MNTVKDEENMKTKLTMVKTNQKMAIMASTILSVLLVFITPTQTSAVIIDHIENGQREIYDTEDPQQEGCEETTLICYFPPNGSGLAAGPPPIVSQPQLQPQQNRINWLELCLNPLVDYVIIEDCYTLTTPDGYTLTSEGQRVLRCLAGGALVGILAPEILIQIRHLGPAVNCGGLGGSQN
jgi:hypothetical protein